MLEELEELLDNINTQIQYLKDLAGDKEFMVHPEREPVSWLKIQDPNGTYVASPLLVAKAQCITAILALKKEYPEEEPEFPEYHRCKICDGPIGYRVHDGHITPDRNFTHIYPEVDEHHTAEWDGLGIR